MAIVRVQALYTKIPKDVTNNGHAIGNENEVVEGQFSRIQLNECSNEDENAG
jgi:hypothetical protein